MAADQVLAAVAAIVVHRAVTAGLRHGPAAPAVSVALDDPEASAVSVALDDPEASAVSVALVELAA